MEKDTPNIEKLPIEKWAMHQSNKPDSTSQGLDYLIAELAELPKDHPRRSIEPLVNPDAHLYPLCKQCGKRLCLPPRKTRCARCSAGLTIGVPDIDDPRRCRHQKNFPSGKVKFCRQWALRGKKYCRYHQHYEKGSKHGGSRTAGSFQGVKAKVDMWHNLVLGKTLTDFMEQFKDGEASEVFDVQSELQLTKAACIPLVSQFDKLLEWRNEYGPAYEQDIKTLESVVSNVSDPAKKAEILQNLLSKKSTIAKVDRDLVVLGQQIQESMDKIADLSAKASKIYTTHQKLIDIEQVSVLVDQLITILYEVCGVEHQNIGQMFERRVRAEVKVPGADAVKVQASAETAQKMMELMAQRTLALPEAISEKPPEM